MAATHRAPKQWSLTKTETVNSFESWRQNLVYSLSLDTNFAPFLVDGAQWEKKTRAAPLRGYTDDGAAVAENIRKTAQQKVTMLELLLGQIANYCPVISRNTIVKNSTCVNDIWQSIRLHYGFQSTGGHFLDFADIHLEAGERPEDLYQRLVAFVEDNLLRQGGGITHHNAAITEDEEMSASLENFVVLTWLRLIHKDLPRLVKQRYGTELRSRSLASIKPEISQALESLLDELQTSCDARVMRSYTHNFKPQSQQKGPKYHTEKKGLTHRTCPLCKTAGRSSAHYLSECHFLPESDKKFIARARQIANIMDEEDDESSEEQLPTAYDQHSAALRIQVRQSPYIDTFYQHHTVRLTLDSGATGNMLRASTAHALGITVKPSSQSAHQADGSSPLVVLGEAAITLVRDNKSFTLGALVVENLDVSILAGTPFMECNDITLRPAKRQIILSDNTIYSYGSQSTPDKQHHVRRAVVRAPNQTTTIWPGDFIEVDVPENFCDMALAVEPKTPSQDSSPWPPPAILHSIARKIRIPNLTEEPRILKKNEHLCQVLPVVLTDQDNNTLPPTVVNTRKCETTRHSMHTTLIKLDPDNILDLPTKREFTNLVDEFSEVFSPTFSGYNGAAGPFTAKVNMGPVLPPQRKGRVPQYSRDKLVELQTKFDELEELGVFQKPEDINVDVEYLNPSFLVTKPSGGYRLVTAFADVGRYSKPQPSLLPDVDSILRQIAQWQYIITSDLTSAFYQIPLATESMKYCGVATPFKCVRVYTRSAMGMPGSETALEELLCRVLGDLLQEGVVVKLADDLFCGGNSPEELIHSWRRVLQALSHSGLCLSASKTVIAPKTTTILGWKWSLGSIQATSHRLTTLATCSLPIKVKDLRSFIGTYKVLSRVIPRCATYLVALEDAVAGRESQDKLTWSDSLQDAYISAQKALSSTKAIVLPRSDDQLWIVTDGAVKSHGIGATLYVMRNSRLKLAGFFSAKLRKQQVTWLPCEIEALAIAVACRHFSPYMIQSKHTPRILTDSKPCVQAFNKLCRGEFSSSPRVSTFLSVVSRYQASVQHVAGTANLLSDHASRNAPECHHDTCQVCSFINKAEESVVRQITTQDIISGNARLPFTSRSAWLAIQTECPDLRRTRAHLRQGTRPSKKLTKIKDIKRYLGVATIANDGLLVIKRTAPLSTTRELIIVPRQVLHGLLTALHIQLVHPSCNQLKLVSHRYLYALDMDKAIEQVTSSCHQCSSLLKVPNTITQQQTSDPPESVGVSFAADVIKRERQLVLVVRECVTSFTASCIIENERGITLRNALICLCVPLRPLEGPPAVIRTDPAPGFVSIVDDQLMNKHHLSIEIGRVKNINKNPVAEKAVQEMEEEIARQTGHHPSDSLVSPLTLAIATATVNTRIRSRGLSAREMWSQRDQFTNDQIPLSDHQIITKQHAQRISNHKYSETSKNPGGRVSPNAHLNVGDLVYLYCDRNKVRGRNRYLVVSIDGLWCNVRKFVGNQLRATSYRMKLCECYKVPSTITPYQPSAAPDTSDELDEINLDQDTVHAHVEAAHPADPIEPPPQIVIPPPTPTLVANNPVPELVANNPGPELDTNNDIPVDEQMANPVDQDMGLRRSNRVKRTPRWHKDYVT